MLSTRSGAWIFPNYIFGQPIDLYACRAFPCSALESRNMDYWNRINLGAG